MIVTTVCVGPRVLLSNVLQVELDECHVQELRRERTRKRRLSSPLNRNRSRVHSVSLAKEDGPPQSESPTEDGSDVNDNAWVTTAQDGTATNGAHGAGGDPRCRVDSAASHSSKARCVYSACRVHLGIFKTPRLF